MEVFGFPSAEGVIYLNIFSGFSWSVKNKKISQPLLEGPLEGLDGLLQASKAVFNGEVALG